MRCVRNSCLSVVRVVFTTVLCVYGCSTIHLCVCVCSPQSGLFVSSDSTAFSVDTFSHFRWVHLLWDRLCCIPIHPLIHYITFSQQCSFIFFHKTFRTPLILEKFTFIASLITFYIPKRGLDGYKLSYLGHLLSSRMRFETCSHLTTWKYNIFIKNLQLHMEFDVNFIILWRCELFIIQSK